LLSALFRLLLLHTCPTEWPTSRMPLARNRRSSTKLCAIIARRGVFCQRSRLLSLYLRTTSPLFLKLVDKFWRLDGTTPSLWWWMGLQGSDHPMVGQCKPPPNPPSILLVSGVPGPWLKIYAAALSKHCRPIIGCPCVQVGMADLRMGTSRQSSHLARTSQSFSPHARRRRAYSILGTVTCHALVLHSVALASASGLDLPPTCVSHNPTH